MIIPKHTRLTTPKGTLYEVVGIWARGGGANYEPVEYELQAAGQPLKMVKRDVLVELIETRKLKTI